MATEHDEMGGSKYTAVYRGQVVDIADPEKIGRVKVIIPGLIDPASNWAFPAGLPGSGGLNRGLYMVPPLGATVCVWFHQGDVDHPFYSGGSFGIVDGRRETPGPVGGYKGPDDEDLASIPPVDATKVPAWEGDRYVMWCDERPGHERLVLRDKKSNDTLEFDGKRGAIGISATTLVHISAALVAIEGSVITLNGRAVTASGNPIM